MTRHDTTAPSTPPTLQAVLDKLERGAWLSDIRRRDLRSAVTGVADLLGQPARDIVVDVPQIGAKLSAVDRMGGARRRSVKTMQNLRSGFVAAVKTTGFMPRRRLARALRPDWTALLDCQSKRRRLGLARLARYASTRGIAPTSINSSVVNAMMADVRAYSLRRNPNQLHRAIILIWNELARERSGLQELEVPSFAKQPTRIAWMTLSEPFRRDHDDYLCWCAGGDVFAAAARDKPLAPRSSRPSAQSVARGPHGIGGDRRRRRAIDLTRRAGVDRKLQGHLDPSPRRRQPQRQ